MTAAGVDLQDRLILVTRPLPEAETFCQLVESANGRALLAPALEIKPPANPEPLQTSLAALEQYDGIIITSANGARAFISGRKEHDGFGAATPSLFVVGGKTGKILQQAGYEVTMPERPSGGEELAHFIKCWRPCGGRLLFLQAEKGRRELVDILNGAGYHIDLVVAYRAEPVKTLPGKVLDALAAGRVGAIPFFSARSATAFYEALPAGGDVWLTKPLKIAISSVTSRSLAKTPLNIDLIADEATAESILISLSRQWQHAG